MPHAATNTRHSQINKQIYKEKKEKSKGPCSLFDPGEYQKKKKKKKKSATATAKSLQSSLTLCNPIDGSPTGSPVPGILQARILEWVAISFSNVWKWKVKVKSLSRVRLLATPWTSAYQAPPSMGSSRQEYWSGVPLIRDTYLCLLIRWLKGNKKMDKDIAYVLTPTL